MSEDISRLPPQVQQRLLRLQQLQQTLQGVLTQKQQLEFELNGVEQALGEIEKQTANSEIYKSVGSILVKSKKSTVQTELNDQKEILNMRIKVMNQQEERLRTQVKDLQEKLQHDLRLISPSS